jgi:ADP-ribose pyrophosphatase
MSEERPGARVHATRVLHRGRAGTFALHELTLPNGQPTELELLAHPGAAAIVPFLDPERILLLRQYRFAAGGEIWEVPAGKRDPGESPEHCAARELIEETGYRAGRWTPLGRILTAPGFTDECIHLFRADALEAGEHAREPTELIELHEFTLAQALAMIDRGEIIDAKTIVGILRSGASAAPALQMS